MIILVHYVFQILGEVLQLYMTSDETLEVDILVDARGWGGLASSARVTKRVYIFNVNIKCSCSLPYHTRREFIRYVLCKVK